MTAPRVPSTALHARLYHSDVQLSQGQSPGMGAEHGMVRHGMPFKERHGVPLLSPVDAATLTSEARGSGSLIIVTPLIMAHRCRCESHVTCILGSALTDRA